MPVPHPHLSRKRHRVSVTALAALLCTAALMAGCAQFPDEHQGAWKDQPSLEPKAGPQPSIEDEAKPPQTGAPPRPPPPPGPCVDTDPSVVATCLNPIGAIAALPDGQSALVGERTTGRILRVRRGAEPIEIAKVLVDSAGGGGLTGLALSPSYHEDELIYAYATTAGGNQVLRIAPGDRPKPILSGIPRGDRGNSGAMLTDGKGALLVATGNAGSPAEARDPASLAGKVLRVDGFGNPAPGNPDPASRVVSSGLSTPGGLCTTPGSGTFWVTDRGGPRETLHQVTPGQPLGTPTWSWPDHPGVAGCAASPSLVVVALTNASALYTLNPGPGGTITGQPTKALENIYGKFSAAGLSQDGLLWLGTANKSGGSPKPTDDRVLRIQPPSGGTAGKE